MSYPNKLLPKRYFKLLESDKLKDKNLLLIRSTPDKDILDNLGQIKTKAIASPTSNIIGYSINLLGVFRIKHSKIEINKVVRSLYTSNWSPPQDFLRPKKNENRIIKEKGFFTLKFEKIHNYPYPITHPNTGISYNFLCKLEHKPTKSNYWHFELHWFDENGERVIVEKGKIRGVPKMISSSMREMFKMVGKVNKPKKIKKLSVKYYK